MRGIIEIISDSINQLKTSLPAICDANLSLEDQARSALHLLFDSKTEFKPPATPSESFQLCPNCGTPSESLSSPYCSEICRDQAAFVRQFRNAIATDSILTSEKQTVFGERLWWLLGGGLPIREARIPESAKRQVIKRCASKCEFCAAPMVTIENFGSGCNRPLHLRAVCANCSKTKPFGDPAFSQSPLLKDLSQRINAPTALRSCDDPQNWDWRAFLAERRSSVTSQIPSNQ